MPRDLFGDVVDPSIKMGNKSGYTVALTMLAEVALVGGHRHRAADGSRYPAHAALDDGVRGGSAAAAPPTAAAPAAAGGSSTARG